MTLETENTNFQTQIHIVSESPSLSFPKGLLLFSGQTTFIIISLVTTLSDRRQNCSSQSPLFFVDPYMLSETFLKVRQKRPRTNKYLRKRMHNLKFIFDFHPKASYYTYMASRSGARKRRITRQNKILTFIVQNSTTSLFPHNLLFLVFLA